MIRMAPEGWPFVLLGLAVTVILAGAGSVAMPLGGGSTTRTVLWATAGVMGILTVFTVHFFRDPVRTPPEGENLVLAPGDGRVIQITQVEEPTFFEGPAARISIFLSIFNVHIQRAPISGIVGHRSYKPGGFAVAWAPKASEENEQASLGIASGPDRILVRQIAGLVARRVVTDPQEGDRLQQGDRIGLIRFGSRVDLFLPPHWQVVCQEGDPVVAGETILARIPEAGGEEGQ